MAKLLDPFKSLRVQTLAAALALVLIGQAIGFALVFVSLPNQFNGTPTPNGANSLADAIFLLPQAEGPSRTKLLNLVRQFAEVEVGAPPPLGAKPYIQEWERQGIAPLAKSLGERSGSIPLIGNKRRTLWTQIALDGQLVWLSITPHSGQSPLSVAFCLLSTAVMLAVLTTFFMTTFVVAPLNHLALTIDRFGRSFAQTTTPERGPREVSSLCRLLNQMIGRISEADSDRNLALAGISHDLRTPLARLRIAFDLSGMSSLPHGPLAERQIDHIQAITSQFMRFVRGFEDEISTMVDPYAFTESITLDYSEHGVQFVSHEGIPKLVIRAESIRRSLVNLIENALKYGARPVTVELKLLNGFARFVVRDQGRGMSQRESARLRRPFVRGQPNEDGDIKIPVPGTGLGLAIVDKIARLHGGELELERLSSGFEARLLIPLPKQDERIPGAQPGKTVKSSGSQGFVASVEMQ